jgi:hypothetical protein
MKNKAITTSAVFPPVVGNLQISALNIKFPPPVIFFKHISDGRLGWKKGSGGVVLVPNSDTLGGMCRKVICRDCGKPSWAGCGAHIESVLGDVPKAERCRCDETPSASTPKKSFFATLFGGK